MHAQLRDIQYFASIAAHGQLQRAAAALGLSQPALSKSLRRLELAMNAKLLKRTPKGIELTSVGSALLTRVGKLRLSLEDVTREITDLSEGRAGHLNIGMADVLAHIVPTACTALIAQAPRLSLKLTTGDHASLVGRLLNGTLDIAVSAAIAPPQDNIVEVCLYEEEAVTIYAAANHRLAKRRQVTLADLAQERWALPPLDTGGIARVLTQAIANLGLPPLNLAIETVSMMARFRLVATSDLLTYGTRSVAQNAAGHLGIVELRLKGLSATRRVGVRYRQDAYLPPAAFRFIEILKKDVQNIAKHNR